MRLNVRGRGVASALLALLLVTATVPHPAAAPSTLSHLRGVDELKSWFNATKGHPRLIFLLSPT